MVPKGYKPTLGEPDSVVRKDLGQEVTVAPLKVVEKVNLFILLAISLFIVEQDVTDVKVSFQPTKQEAKIVIKLKLLVFRTTSIALRPVEVRKEDSAKITRCSMPTTELTKDLQTPEQDSYRVIVNCVLHVPVVEPREKTLRDEAKQAVIVDIVLMGVTVS